MAPLGNSISLRLVAFLLGAVVLFNLAMALVFFEPLGRQQAQPRMPVPAQAAAIVDVLEKAPPDQRPRLLNSMNSATLSLRLLDQLPPNAAQRRSAPVLTRFLQRYDKAFANHEVHVDLQRNDNGALGFGQQRAGWRPARVYIHLSDGPWLVIEPIRSQLITEVLSRGLIVVAVVGVLIIVLLVIAARQTARPIEKLAAGARQFAERLDAPDLETKGPKELRELASSFNDMKHRIRGLVQERTRLVAAIAHDLRTYMTRLSMRAEFIEDPKQRERAERDIAEMSALIGDTLLFARSAERQEEDVPAFNVLPEISAFVSARKELGEAVTFTAPAAAMPAIIEPIALRRILANIVDNALRYGGGSAVELSVAREGEGVVLEVADRGPGIPEGELDRLVAPFERLEPSRGRSDGGSGLGLAIVKALAESHGGAFSLANRPGGGAIARVTLKAG